MMAQQVVDAVIPAHMLTPEFVREHVAVARAEYTRLTTTPLGGCGEWAKTDSADEYLRNAVLVDTDTDPATAHRWAWHVLHAGLDTTPGAWTPHSILDGTPISPVADVVTVHKAPTTAVAPAEPTEPASGTNPTLASEVREPDLTDPNTLKILVDFAHTHIAGTRVNWATTDRETQLQILSKGIRPYLAVRNWTALEVRKTAERLLNGGHINPPAVDVVTAPTKTKKPPRMTAKERAVSRKTKPNDGFTAIPVTLLAKTGSDYAMVQAAKTSYTGGGRNPNKMPPHLMPWAPRVFAEVMNSTGPGRNGGEATVTPKQAADAIRHDPQTMGKFLVHAGPMTPWVVSASRKHQVLPVGKPFVRFPHWMRDDLALNPCAAVNQRLTKNLKVAHDLSGPALENLTVLAVLTVQRHAQWDATGANNDRDSAEDLARMAGASVRMMKYGLAEAERRHWMTSYGKGGFSKPAYRRVHYIPLAENP